MKKRWFLLLTVLLLLLAALASAQEAYTPIDWSSVPREQTSHFTFRRATKMENYKSVEVDEIYITGYTGNAQILRIPDTIGGMPVTGITEEILVGNETLTHVYLPDTIETMYWSCLEGCTNLVEAHLPARLSFLPTNMFKDCVNLRYVEMPEALVEIGYDAFRNCALLTEIKLPERVQAISGGAFAGTAIAEMDLSRVGVLQGGEIFEDCKNLTSVKLSDTLYHYNELDSDIFAGCSALMNLEIVPGLCTVTAEQADEFIDGYELDDMETGKMSVKDGTLYWNDLQILTFPDKSEN